MSIAVQGAFPGRRAWLAESNPRADPARYLLGFQGVYDGRWHCLSSSGGKIELFDSTADPKETRDLAAEHPDIVERLRALMPLTF
jgi:hypothetical protein